MTHTKREFQRNDRLTGAIRAVLSELLLQDVNDPPVGMADGGGAFTTDEDTAFTTGNVLTNDTDEDLPANTLSVAGLDVSGTAGMVSDNGDGTFDYDPNGQFEGLDDGETATDTFTYILTDRSTGNSATNTATTKISTIDQRPMNSTAS